MLLHPRLASTVLGAVVPLALAPVFVAPANADPTAPPTAPPASSTAHALDVLAHAQEALHGAHDATLALVDLRKELPHLDRRDRTAARALFARPDGTNGTYNDPGAARWSAAETAAARSTCDDPAYDDLPFCVHWVPEGTTGGLLQASRQAASNDAVAKTITAMTRVWSTEIGRLGYRAPRGDGSAGSEQVPTTDRLDVYLADTGRSAIYGYAVPEGSAQVQASAGYLVLDNDFSSTQFGGATPPDGAREVTAAHEFFHLVQFAYDADENPWLMESTATWMEEHVFSAVNDNRQYISSGSLHWPGQPVDTFARGAQYGTWVFHELLSQRLGSGVVLQTWRKAASVAGDNARAALSSALRGAGSSLTAEFRTFSGASIVPGRFWREGSSYPRAVLSRTWTLSGATRSTGHHEASIDHLASVDVAFRPDTSLTGDWKLRLRIDAPSSGATAYALVFFRDGSLRRVPLTLNGSGDRTYDAPFSARKVSRVAVALGNASETDGRTTGFRATIWR
jgi:hypothetical protein